MAAPVDGGTAEYARREAGVGKRAVVPAEGGGETEPPAVLTPSVTRRGGGGGGGGRPVEKAADSLTSWQHWRRRVRSPAGGPGSMTGEPGRRDGWRDEGA